MLVLLIAAAAFVGAAISWNMATVAVLRRLGINLSFWLPFRLYRRQPPEVLNALRGRTINAYVAVSGLLLFACPLFAGLSAYDYVVRRYLQHSPYYMKYVLASIAWLLLLVIVGVWVSLGDWQKGAEKGIGIAMLAILVLKVSTDLTGSLMAAVFVVAAAAFCSFVYFAVRRIRGGFSGQQYPARREMQVQQDFVSERFVPSENATAEKVAKVQQLMALRPSLDSSSDEQCGDERE